MGTEPSKPSTAKKVKDSSTDRRPVCPFYVNGYCQEGKNCTKKHEIPIYKGPRSDKGLDTVLCLDTSGSMAGRGLRELKKACLEYIAGVEQNKRQYGLEENIAIVEFGRHQQVLCHLTNDYDALRKVINSLQSSGRTPMAEALGEALGEILHHGGVLTIRGHKITPRIVLMTDGKPTDEEGETKAVEKVAAFGVAFGQAWKEVGLPHPVPIACVGCGDCDADLLNGLARVTGGMATLVDDLGELTNFFKKQVLLTRFVAQFEGDLRRALTMEALREFFRGELEQDLQGAELAAMLQLLGTMLRLEGRDSQIVGEQVTISADVTSVKRSAAGFGGWIDRMAAYCGKTGTLVEAAPKNGKLTVRFSDGQELCFNPSVVTRANPRGPIGSRVTVLADEDRVRQLAKGHGGWITDMSRTIGRSGEVLKVDSDGDVRVFFRDLNLQPLVYHPEALVGYKPYGATAVTEATWSCIACATQHTEGKAVLSNCRNCGTPRGSAAAAPAQRHVAPATATLPWICTQCKASNTSSGFCGSCGTAKGSVPAPADQHAEWACTRCTAQNSTSNFCGVCGERRVPVQTVQAAAWTCRLCTLINQNSNQNCEVCGGSK